MKDGSGDGVSLPGIREVSNGKTYLLIIGKYRKGRGGGLEGN